MLEVQDSIPTDEPSEVRILVVDDDALARFILADQLDALGCRCIDTAADGIDALKQALEHSYDLIITDLCMPNMGGKRLLAALRAYGLEVPVIAVTAWGEPASARTNATSPDAGPGMPNSFAAILRKPISMGQLQQLLRMHLDRTRLGRTGVAPALAPHRALQMAFAAAWSEDEAALRAAFASCDTRALQARLHRLHGALAVLGEARARRACAQLQEHIFRAGVEPSAPRFERFMQLCATIGCKRPRGRR